MNYMTAPALIPLKELSIIDNISKLYKVSVKDIKSRNKHRKIVEARQVIMYLLRTKLKYKSKKVGLIFKRDHATVLHAVKVIENRIELGQLLINEKI